MPGLSPDQMRHALRGALTPHITGSKKQSDEERGAAIFAVRVHVIVMPFLCSKDKY